MRFNQRPILIAIASVVVLTAQAGQQPMTTLRLGEQDLPYFRAVDAGLLGVAALANECLSEEGSLYPCFCKDTIAQAQLETALSNALKYKPEWNDQILYHDGVNLVIPGLVTQVEYFNKQCANDSG